MKVTQIFSTLALVSFLVFECGGYQANYLPHCHLPFHEFAIATRPDDKRSRNGTLPLLFYPGDKHIWVRIHQPNHFGRYPLFPEEPFQFIWITVFKIEAYHYYFNRFVFVPIIQLIEFGQLLYAWHAPGSPEINNICCISRRGSSHNIGCSNSPYLLGLARRY